MRSPASCVGQVYCVHFRGRENVRFGSTEEGSQVEITMTQHEKLLYTAMVHTSGGRDGDARSGDGRLDIKLSPPGTAGTGTNPEQLFAAGWSACFLGAVRIAAGKRKVALPAGTAIDAEVDLCTSEGAFFLEPVSTSACRAWRTMSRRRWRMRLIRRARIPKPHGAISMSQSTLSIPK